LDERDIQKLAKNSETKTVKEKCKK